jgi:hypothetical protein
VLLPDSLGKPVVATGAFSGCLGSRFQSFVSRLVKMTLCYFLGDGFFFWVVLFAFCKKENKQIKNLIVGRRRLCGNCAAVIHRRSAPTTGKVSIGYYRYI